MKTKRLTGLGLALSMLCNTSFSQEDQELKNTTYYQAEAFTSAASGTNTPLWIVSNRYGKVPLESGNGYFNAGVFHNQSFKKDFYWNAGLDFIATAPRYRNVYIHQLFVEAGYKSLRLTIGSKENTFQLWDRNLSSGDMVLSTNARPIPEINLSIQEFTAIPGTKGWLSFKGDFAVGKSYDTAYLEDFINPGTTYVKNVLWHHKSFHLQVKDANEEFPFSLALGLQHWAQWGGTSSKESIGKQPQSFKDFIRIVFGKEGGDGATSSDMINVLGNHYGSYDFKLGYKKDDLNIYAYHQRYFEDKSGTIFNNGLDGLWGVELDLPWFSWLKKVVLETVNTRNQSGPFHFIDFDHNKYPGYGGGADNYYNNGEYVTGVSYFNRGIGNPLLNSPEYNTDGTLGFKNTRVRNFHFGAEGDISDKVNYRLRFTALNGWGLHKAPFLNKKTGTATSIDINYAHPRAKGWLFGGSLAADTGDYFGKSLGFALTVSKRGIIKNWK